MSVMWLATRSTGLVALILLTLVTVLGIATSGGWGSSLWPRLVTNSLHRRLSLLSIVFLFIHIATTVLDGYVPVGWLDVVVPFASPYKTLWLGLSALAVDLLIAVMVTSYLRGRIGIRSWRAIHLLAYGAWGLATIHALGVGTDRMLTYIVALGGVVVVAITALARVTVPARVTV